MSIENVFGFYFGNERKTFPRTAENITERVEERVHKKVFFWEMSEKLYSEIGYVDLDGTPN